MSNAPNPDIFRPLDVPDRLRPYVRRILLADTAQAVDFEIPVVASGYHYFGWVWRGRWQGICDGEVLFDSDFDGPLHVSGQVSKSNVSAGFRGKIGQAFFEFSALGHYQLLGITGAKLLEDAKAPQALNTDLEPYFAPLLNVPDISADARLELMAGVLSNLPRYPVPASIVAGVQRIEEVDGNIRLAELLAQLGIAERQFRTDFSRLIGLAPKAFCKTLQINKALNQLLEEHKGDLAGVAAQSGFSDQAHFTRAFREFLGKSPGTYVGNVEVTLARFVGQSRAS